MQKKGFLLIGLVLGIAIGWPLGFLRLPFLENDASFWVGALGGGAALSLIILLLKKRQSEPPSGPARVLLLGLPLSGLLLGGFYAYRRCSDLQDRVRQQERQLQALTASIDSNNSQNLAPLLHALLGEIEVELQGRPDRSLRDTTVARIAALSQAFKPYQSVEKDSVSTLAWSPERGQLLLALALLRLNTGTFARIKAKVPFTGADLRKADLKGLDLSTIQLQDANLQDADLSGANLSGARLGNARLWGAQLNRTRLDSADLKRADLRWARFHETVLNNTNLSGALLSNAQWTKAILKGVNMQWVQADGAWFNEAQLTGMNCTGANFTKANLAGSEWRDSDWRKASFKDADFSRVRLDKVLVDNNWQAELEQWQPLGGREISNTHSLTGDSLDKAKTPIYRLQLKQQ